MDSILHSKNYSEFKTSLAQSNCQKCMLSQSRIQIVVDRGNPEAKVLIIGEAPGRNEDLEGKVFVGRGGKLLDAMMGELGFDTNQESLIINVVKCRPPENRVPSREEVAACAPFLRKQIELVQPKIILLLGATALKRIIPAKKQFSMKEEAGKFFEDSAYPGVQLMVLYHPAYILRGMTSRRPMMIEHLERFVESYGSLCKVT